MNTHLCTLCGATWRAPWSDGPSGHHCRKPEPKLLLIVHWLQGYALGRGEAALSANISALSLHLGVPMLESTTLSTTESTPKAP